VPAHGALYYSPFPIDEILSAFPSIVFCHDHKIKEDAEAEGTSLFKDILFVDGFKKLC
jgi:hypothetical protein